MAEAAAAAAGDRELKARGAYIINIHNAGHGRNGVADRLAIYRGRALVIEYKRPGGGHLSKLQRYELGRAQLAGARTLVARSRADVRQALDAIDNEIDETRPTETIHIDGQGCVCVLGHIENRLAELGVAAVEVTVAREATS